MTEIDSLATHAARTAAAIEEYEDRLEEVIKVQTKPDKPSNTVNSVEPVRKTLKDSLEEVKARLKQREAEGFDPSIYRHDKD